MCDITIYMYCLSYAHFIHSTVRTLLTSVSDIVNMPVSDSGIELLSELRFLIDLDLTGCVSLTDQASLHPDSNSSVDTGILCVWSNNFFICTVCTGSGVTAEQLNWY